VVNPLKVKEWLLKRIILKEGDLSEQDIIAIILDQDGNQDIGHVEHGNKINKIKK
jgi:hypothetical protein